MVNFQNFNEIDELRTILGLDSNIFDQNSLNEYVNKQENRNESNLFKSFELLNLGVNSNFLKAKEESENNSNQVYQPVYKEKTFSKNNSLLNVIKVNNDICYKISDELNCSSKSLINNVLSNYPAKEINRNKIKLNLFIENMMRKFKTDKNAKVTETLDLKDKSKGITIYKLKENRKKFFTKILDNAKVEEDIYSEEEEKPISNSNAFAEKTRIKANDNKKDVKKKIMNNKNKNEKNNNMKDNNYVNNNTQISQNNVNNYNYNNQGQNRYDYNNSNYGGYGYVNQNQYHNDGYFQNEQYSNQNFKGQNSNYYKSYPQNQYDKQGNQYNNVNEYSNQPSNYNTGKKGKKR